MPTKNPLLISAYRARYLNAILWWLVKTKAQDYFRILVWDNGGVADICAEFQVECYSAKHPRTGQVVNIGKALGIDHLIELLLQERAEFDCYVCMDDDILVDAEQLRCLASTALRPGLGMIGGYYHPFNTPALSEGSLVRLEPCSCASNHGICLRVYPQENRSEKRMGMVGGGIFAIARKTAERLPWAPHLYPLLYKDGDPVVYWREDGTLDCELTSLGFTNGYLESPRLTPAVHLPELDVNYHRWKHEAIQSSMETTAYPRG